MKNLIIKLLTIISLITLPSTSLSAQNIENPVSWTTSVETISAGEYKIIFSAAIDRPWYMYDLGPYEDAPNPTIFTFEPSDNYELISNITPFDEPSKAFDELYNKVVGHYMYEAKFYQIIKSVDDIIVNVKCSVEWSVCDKGVCLNPETKDFTIKIGTKEGVVTNSTLYAQGSSTGVSLWSTIIEAILWGFAALLTPCVFPMVPMTVSFFMKGVANPRKGRFMAALYGISIVALYTIPIAVIILVTKLLGGDSVTADIFNWLATHWVPNVIFFLVFMIFAASFFGAFEITMPSKLVNKSDSQADKGGLIGIFFMALTLVLVSFSCTGPIVGSVLIKSTSGEIWAPVVTMLAFSTAFALPFTLFAFFPSLLKNLPKSGGWLNSVKVVLGFLELALGLKFLSVADQTYHWGILDREIYLALWIVIFSLLGLYLLGKLRFAHDDETKNVSVTRLLLSIITFSFVVYMIPGMFGAPLKGLSGYLPPLHTQDFVLGANTRTSTSNNPANTLSGNTTAKYSDFLHLPFGLTGFFDYSEAVAYAKKVNKPIFVDYTGHGCVNCREMESKVWSDPKVLEILRNDYVILALYSDDKKILPESDWVTTSNGRVLKSLGKINADFAHKNFGINFQPYYIILDSDGKQITPGRGYDLSIDGFIEFLESGLKTNRE